MNFNGILIGSEDPQRLTEYYSRLFGKPQWDEGGYTGWMIGSGGVSIGPHDQVKGRNAQPGRIIWNIESPDVKGDFERFKAAEVLNYDSMMRYRPENLRDHDQVKQYY